MPMKTPNFWYGENEHAPLWLLPLSWLYGLGRWTHKTLTRSYKPKAKVLCIGNIVAGGSGKTPSALSIMDIIKKEKLAEAPFFLTRGYGGDEDQILSKHALTIVNANRKAGAIEAQERGADLILLDDGFQNPSLHKDISIVVIDGSMGFGNRALLPAGPLREPIAGGLKRADGFILIGEDLRDIEPSLPDKPLFRAHFKPTAKIDKKAKYIAFAGLGYPQKFFNTLRDLVGEHLLETVSFPDHHPYTKNDLQALRDKALELGATLITTEKDAARLSETDDDIEVLPVEMEWQDKGALTAFLKERLGA